MEFNSRMCSSLWYKPTEKLSASELELLEEAFKRGLQPLGDLYGDHYLPWVEWKNSVLQEIQNSK